MTPRESTVVNFATYDGSLPLDMIRLGDMSTQASEQSSVRCSSIIEETELYTPVSFSQMVKNVLQSKKLEAKQNQKEWCFTARVVPRNWVDHNMFFIQQKSKKGRKTSSKTEKIKDVLERHKRKYLGQDFIEYLKESKKREIQFDTIY